MELQVPLNETHRRPPRGDGCVAIDQRSRNGCNWRSARRHVRKTADAASPFERNRPHSRVVRREQERENLGPSARMKEMTMADTGTLHDAFVDELRDTYDAEKQLTKALAKMAKAASSPDLKSAFEAHLEETRGQIERLDEVFASLDEKARGKH